MDQVSLTASFGCFVWFILCLGKLNYDELEDVLRNMGEPLTSREARDAGLSSNQCTYHQSLADHQAD